MKVFNGGIAMKKCFLSALLTLLIVCCSDTNVYADTTQNQSNVKETVLEEKTVKAEAGCSTADLQALLNENAEGKYDLTVSIPAGTYKLTETLYVYPNTTIEADEEAILEKQSLYGAMLEAKLPEDSSGYTGSHDIVIEGGIWDSTPVMKSGKGTETFRFAHSTDISVLNAVLRNVPEGSHFMVLEAVANVTIANCSFYGYENWEKTQTPAEAIKLLSDGVVCDDISIFGCDFYQLSRGIGCDTVKGKYHNNVKIDTNDFHDLSETAIYLSNYKKSRVNRNTITDVGGSGIYVKSSPEIRIMDNTIKNAGNLGIYLYKSGGSDANNCSKIGDNTITGKKSGTGKHGIKISTSNYTAVYNNSITDIGGTAIYVNKSKNCKIGLGNSTYNTIENTTEKGIYVNKTCDGIKVQYNKISGTKEEGILVYASKKATINRNTISAGTDGILVKNNCTSAKISNNTIKTAGNYGIYVSKKCTSVKITSNTIKKYATKAKDAAAIYIHQSGGTSSKKYTSVSKNTITGTGKSTKKYGIYVSGSRYTKVERNTLNYIPGTAIYVYKTKNCTVSENTIKKPNKMGIYLTTNCNGGKISSNVVKKAAGTSIKISDAPKTLIYSNTITATKNKKGIVVSNSMSSTIKTNTITGTKEELAIKISKSKKCEESNNTTK